MNLRYYSAAGGMMFKTWWGRDEGEDLGKYGERK